MIEVFRPGSRDVVIHQRGPHGGGHRRGPGGDQVVREVEV